MNEKRLIDLNLVATEAAARAIGSAYLAQCDSDMLPVEVRYLDAEGKQRIVGVEPSIADDQLEEKREHDA